MRTHPQRNLTTVFLTLTLAAPALGAQKIYWTDTFTAKIQRSNPDGTNVEDLATTGLELPRGIALDIAGGKMYWTDSGTNALGRCNLDGSNCEELVTGLMGPRGIALDLAAGRMNWASSLGGMIRRANLDGTGMDTMVAGLAAPMGVALDLPVGKVYWADANSDRIHRANLDGSDIESLVTALGDPIGIALDLAGGTIYWTDFATGKIQRANLDGSSVEDLVIGLDRPLGLALDLAAGKMYWTLAGPGGPDDFDGKIQRANFDGSGIEDVVTAGLKNPRDIAIRPDPCLNGQPCDDGNRCTTDDVCIDGICVGAPSSAACDDGNPCTASDVCNGGMCSGIPGNGTCDNGNPCAEDVCVDGACISTLNYDLDTCFHYSLLVTEVNGTPCPSCPTVDLPASEVRPGDTITIEAHLANWGPQTIDSFQWAIDTSSFDSNRGNGVSGFLSLPNVPCSTDADCPEVFVQSSACTCNGSKCQVYGLCDVYAAVFIDFSRPDFPFPGGTMGRTFSNIFTWTGLAGFGVDPGHPIYVGTLVLTASSDARGTFTLAMLDEPGDTAVLAPDGSPLGGLQLQPLVISFCDVVDSPNDCNNNDLPDECEPDRDGDGLIDECDPCPDDPSDATGADTDGDGVLDCNDQCPGADDAIFAPECAGTIPTVSEWGLVAMTLLLLTGGKICFGRRRLAL